METQIKTSGGAKDFFINLGAIVALYTLVISLINLLFTVINTAYPQITNGYNYLSSASISWPVATLIIFFPIFILLMYLMEKAYIMEPERKSVGIHKWLTYITLFISGLALVGDLIMVLYYFIDGQELTAGFLLKILVVLVIAGAIFTYYISEIRDRLTSKSRKIWRIVAGVIILASIVWGFTVLGSPRTQRLYKYDEQKVNDLMNISNQIQSFYGLKGILPKTLDEMSPDYYYPVVDVQNQKSYEYEKTGDTTYNLCAEFNQASNDGEKMTAPRLSYPQYGGVISWIHPDGYHCFTQSINPNIYSKPVPIR